MNSPEHADDDIPDFIDPYGVPSPRSGTEAFIMLIATFVATLALIVTVGWIVIYHLRAAG